MFKSPNEIPGMIEPIEQEMLIELSETIKFDKNDQIVEFGSFFGRSTYCLATGLKNNKTCLASNKITAFDSFMCRKNGSFYPYVIHFAKLGKVENLIKYENDDIDFEGIFKHFLNNEITSNLVKAEKVELEALI